MRLVVSIWGTTIGYISKVDDNYLFEYDNKFVESGIELSPIKMPLSHITYSFPELKRSSFEGLPGLVYDSLPDRFGNTVILNYLQSRGLSISEVNPLQRLSYIGNRGMGGLEYKPEMVEPYSYNLEIDSLVSLADDILNRRNKISIDANKAEAMKQLYEISSSAGGARAKAIIAWNKKSGEIKSGQIDAGKGFDYYLLKFDGISNNGDHGLLDSKGYTQIEYAYYLMALDCEIKMMTSELYTENGRNHFITKRYDRINGQKLHCQTFASLAHVDFNQICSSSYEMMYDVCLKLGVSKNDVEQLYRQLVFNVLACNNDDHPKNFSFVMNKDGKWSKAPAYDLTFSYDLQNKWLKQHQMLINNKNKGITLYDLQVCAKYFNIKSTKANQIINDIANVINNWNKYADIANVSKYKNNVTEILEQRHNEVFR